MCVQSMASSSSHLPLSQAWFKATALGSVPHQQSQLQRDSFGSGGKAGVSATDFSCQVGSFALCSLLLYNKHKASWLVMQTWAHCLHHRCTAYGCWAGDMTEVCVVQMAETMYSCIMLALKLLAAFCPEVGPQHELQQGWPRSDVLISLQVCASSAMTVNLRDSGQ